MQSCPSANPSSLSRLFSLLVDEFVLLSLSLSLSRLLMENGKATENTITRSLQNFEIHLNRNIPKSTRNTHSTLRSSILPIEKPKPPSLVGSCLGVVGKHFEDIIEDLGDIASNFPADIKEVRVTRESRRQEKTIKKLVVDTETNKVLGASMCGPDAAEIMQGNVVHTSTISEYDLGGEGDLFKAPEAIIEEPAVGFDPMTAAISMGPLDDY